MAPPRGEAPDDSGGFWVKSKRAKPARWSGMLAIAAALAAVALTAERATRTRRRAKRSGKSA